MYTLIFCKNSIFLNLTPRKVPLLSLLFLEMITVSATQIISKSILLPEKITTWKFYDSSTEMSTSLET